MQQSLRDFIDSFGGIYLLRSLLIEKRLSPKKVFTHNWFAKSSIPSSGAPAVELLILNYGKDIPELKELRRYYAKPRQGRPERKTRNDYPVPSLHDLIFKVCKGPTKLCRFYNECLEEDRKSGKSLDVPRLYQTQIYNWLAIGYVDSKFARVFLKKKFQATENELGTMPEPKPVQKESSSIDDDLIG